MGPKLLGLHTLTSYVINSHYVHHKSLSLTAAYSIHSSAIATTRKCDKEKTMLPKVPDLRDNLYVCYSIEISKN